MIVYITAEQIVKIHDAHIYLTGGMQGLRDCSLIQSAIGRYKSDYYINIFEKAAALWESLSQNHPFFDANKRTAFSATLIFMKRNKIEIKCESSLLVYDFVNDMHKNNCFNFDNILKWISNNTEYKK